jgi:VWFA-related protein
MGTLLWAALQGLPQEQPAIRITVNLVQVDAVVTDAKGRHVTGLGKDDFEILQDGKPQKITSFSYVSTVPPEAPPERKPGVPAPPAVSPPTIRPQQVRRTVALVIDDLGLSWESMAQVKDAARKFIEEKLQPGDVAAVVRTGAGMGSLQGFTTDRRLLQAALARVNWNPFGRGGVSAFPAIGGEQHNVSGVRGGRRPATLDSELGIEDRTEEFRTEAFTVGTLGAINWVVRGLHEFPGRKSVVLFSDNIRIFNRNRDSALVLDELQRLTDQANRSSVVIYSIDPRGLPVLNYTAADDTSQMTSQQLIERASRRRQDYFESQDGLNYLASQTGGKFLYDTNDLTAALSEVLEDLSGYYLIGYSPAGDTFNKEFHRIRVRVKRPGLRVRSRSGFYGIPDGAAKPVYKDKDQQLFAALSSPFASGDVHLRLTALFANAQKEGSIVRSLLHISGRDLQYTQEEGGWHGTTLDLMQITYGENGEAVDRSNNTYSIRVRGPTYRHALANGYIYTMLHPVKKAGAYQLRIAVRDATSGRIGSATQFIEVPDIAKGGIAVSGIILRAKQADTATDANIAAKTNPAVRIFERGQELQYGFYVYNAKLETKTGRPDLTSRLRLFREGKFLLETSSAPIRAGQQQDLKRIALASVLRISPEIDPGEYLLQIEITDKLRGGRKGVVSQWIDFQVQAKP